MGKEALNNIEGVAVYPLISLFIFLVFFLILGVYVYKMKKTTVVELKNLPFDNESKPQNSIENA